MNFGQAISSCLSKYATFTGGVSLLEFWWFFLFQILISLAASMLGETINGVAIRMRLWSAEIFRPLKMAAMFAHCGFFRFKLMA